MQTITLPAIGEHATLTYRKADGTEQVYNGTVVKPNAAQAKSGNLFLQLTDGKYKAFRPDRIIDLF